MKTVEVADKYRVSEVESNKLSSRFSVFWNFESISYTARVRFDMPIRGLSALMNNRNCVAVIRLRIKTSTTSAGTVTSKSRPNYSQSRLTM